MTNPKYPLELNIGFLITAEVGTCRDFSFDYDNVMLGDDLHVSDFSGVATFSRTQQGLLVQGRFSAKTGLDCVRCLENYSQDLSCEFTDLYAFNTRSMSESELLVPEEGRIDLAPLIREYVLLEVPIQPICRTECKGLCPVCGENLNHIDCGHRNKPDDSPFSILKDILQ